MTIPLWHQGVQGTVAVEVQMGKDGTCSICGVPVGVPHRTVR